MTICIQCGKELPRNGYVTDYFISWCSKKCHKAWKNPKSDRIKK